MHPLLRFAPALALMVGIAGTQAAVPPPERMLPADTLAILTVPDWDRATAFYKSSAMRRLWDAPEMKPFREKFEERWKTEYAEPMERDLGFKLADLADLVHGQVTIGILPSVAAEPDAKGGVVLIADARDRKDALAAKLAEVKRKWIDAGKEHKSERVRDVEFTTFLWVSTNKPPVAPRRGSAGADDADDLRSQSGAKPKKEEMSFGMSGSLLLAGADPKDFERILANLAGASAPTLAEVPEFEANAAAMFRNARAYGWVNMKAASALILKKIAGEKPAQGAANPFAPAPDKVFEALGLTSLKTVAFNLGDSGDGALADFFLGAPESGRKGLFKLLAPEAKDASPPPFVPRDAIKFSRWRADGKKLWAGLEELINSMIPQLAGVLQMGMESVGKDKDPNFDLKKTLIGNLGDDVITWQKAPRGSAPADITSPPSVYLVGSPNPEQLTLALKTGIVLLGGRTDSLTERELLGRKVYKVKMMPGRNPGGRGTIERSLTFTQGGGYVAISSDEAMVEEFLRGLDNPGPRLRDTPGLTDAAQRVGGMGSGWFGFENQAESMRALFEAARKDPAFADKMLAASTATTLAGVAGAVTPGRDAARKNIRDLFDLSLLPPFEQVAKYFHHSVNAVSAQGDGIHFKTFMPTPPGLKN